MANGSSLPMESGVVSLLTRPPHPWRPRSSFTFLALNPLPTSQYRCSFSTRYRRWDSNAETVRSQGFNFGFKRGGDEEEEEEVDDDDEYEYDGIGWKKKRWWSDGTSRMDDGPFGILEETIDTVWIFKVQTFNSFFDTFLLVYRCILKRLSVFCNLV